MLKKYHKFNLLVNECKEFFNEIFDGKVFPNRRVICEYFAEIFNRHYLLREIYNLLIIRAIERKIITYGELARELNIKLKENILPTTGRYMGQSLGYILGVISAYEWACGRPLLSSLVVRKDTHLPSEGLKNLMNSLGIDVDFKKEQHRCFIEWGYYDTQEPK